MTWHMRGGLHVSSMLYTRESGALAYAVAPSVKHGWRMLDMAAYLIAKFKYGVTPTVLRDTLFVSHRTQPAAALPQWRQSVQQETATTPVVVHERQARESMIEQLRHRDYQQQKQESAVKRRESARDLAMRTGQLTSKHQAAMRKMQAQVNEAGVKK